MSDLTLYQTSNEDDLIRIEDDNGAMIAVALNEGVGRIKAVYVPEEFRRQHVATTLFRAAHREVYETGRGAMEFDFPDIIEGMPELMSSLGYKQSADAEIIRVDIGRLISSKVTGRIMSNSAAGTTFTPVCDLFMKQWDELLETFDRYSIMINGNDMNRFSQTLSGVVYDDFGVPEAFILSTESDRNIHVEVLGGFRKNDTKFISAALKGFMEGIMENGGDDAYDTVSLVAANEKVYDLIKLAFPEGNEPGLVGKSIFACRIIDEASMGSFEVIPRMKFDVEMNEEVDLFAAGLIDNLSWKMPWVRERMGKPDRTASDTSVGILSVDPPKDEREGLYYEDTIRITSKNVSQYLDYMDQDAAFNVGRKYFGGLAVLSRETREPLAMMIWEIKNAEEETDVEAEISWMRVDDEKAGETLLGEFDNEVEDEELSRTWFQIENMSDLMKSAFENKGFTLQEREGDKLYVSVGRIKKGMKGKQKFPPYVKSLSQITDKQYKRGVTNCLFNERKGLLEDFAFIPRDWFDNDISSCIVMDGDVIGFFLCHHVPSGKLIMDFLFSMGPDSGRDILLMLQFTRRAVASKFPDDTLLEINRHNEYVRKLSDKLFVDIEGAGVTAGEK